VRSELFTSLDRILGSQDPVAGFDYLIEEFRAAKEYGLLFEARLMKSRCELRLPLIQTGEILNPAYQDAMVAAAREAGTLFLADGNIERAWPYFRAIGEPAPVVAAIEKVEPADGIDPIISIAFEQGVHPVKGLELMIAQYGMCRAITSFGMVAVPQDRDKCIALLATNLHGEIVRRMRNAIEAQEGSAPASGRIPELMHGRDWLFGEWDYYVDTSHLLSVLPYCTDISEPSMLETFVELCRYGQKLSPQFQQPGTSPFEDQFTAYAHYAEALLGRDVEAPLEYFREKVKTADPELAGDAPARVLTKLLVALGRPKEALAVVLESVYEDEPYGTPVPSALQLCYSAGDFGALKDLARERGDLLSYAAGSILAKTE